LGQRRVKKRGVRNIDSGSHGVETKKELKKGEG